MSEATGCWALDITTGDFHGACRALAEVCEGWRNQALNSKNLTHDDDVDSDVEFSVRVYTLADLERLLAVANTLQHVGGKALRCSIVGQGVTARARLGRPWMAKTDGASQTLFIDPEHRQTALHRAVDEAISILEEAQR